MIDSPKQQRQIRLWGALTSVVVIVLLFLGLRPKGLYDDNPVVFLPDKGAIAIGTYGIAFVNDLSSLADPTVDDALTIEMAVASNHNRVQRFGSLLMLHDGSDRRQLFVGQWKSSLVVMNGDDYNYRQHRPRLAVTNAFPYHQQHLITIVAGNGATRLYLDGQRAASNLKWQLTVPRDGRRLRLIVGNSVSGKNSWNGEFYGLALYSRMFSKDQVQRHYKTWRRQKRFPLDHADGLQAAYTFQSISGGRIEDRSGNRQTLKIPELPIVLQKAYLAAPWRHVSLDRFFFTDILLNFIGFVPLGASLMGLQTARNRFSGRRSGLVIVLACCLLSLTIEILQAWMPTRSSSWLDLTLNTLGGWMGMWLFGLYSRGKMTRQTP